MLFYELRREICDIPLQWVQSYHYLRNRLMSKEENDFFLTALLAQLALHVVEQHTLPMLACLTWT